MNSFKTEDSQNITKIVLVVYLFLACFLLIFPSSNFVHSARALFSYVLYPSLNYGAKSEFYLRNIPKNISNLLKTDQENRRLSVLLNDNKIALNHAGTLIKENERLTKLLGVSSSFAWNGTWARIINKSPNNCYGSLFVDKGVEQGITVNSTVIAADGETVGLVGRVFEVYNNFSKVVLVTDNRFSSVGVFGREETESLIEGRGTELLKMSHIPIKADIEQNTEVFTSRTSILFPQGISIGKVSKIYSKDMVMNFMVADLFPTIGINAIKEVYIISRILPKEMGNINNLRN